MQTRLYRRINSDGSVTIVDGVHILDYTDSVIAEARTYATILANQDPAICQLHPRALRGNLERVEQVCDLLTYILSFAQRKTNPPSAESLQEARR